MLDYLFAGVMALLIVACSYLIMLSVVGFVEMLRSR